jgi:hypothetical protein
MQTAAITVGNKRQGLVSRKTPLEIADIKSTIPPIVSRTAPTVADGVPIGANACAVPVVPQRRAAAITNQPPKEFWIFG